MSSCEEEASPAGSAEEFQAPPTSNEHTAKWRLYTNKAAQLAREVMSMHHKSCTLRRYVCALSPTTLFASLPTSGCCALNIMDTCSQHKLEDAEKYMSAALSEAIKGFGNDDPHVAAARQNLAEQYRVMHKYDLALPLYDKVRSMLPIPELTLQIFQAAKADIPGKDFSIRQIGGALQLLPECPVEKQEPGYNVGSGVSDKLLRTARY